MGVGGSEGEGFDWDGALSVEHDGGVVDCVEEEGRGEGRTGWRGRTGGGWVDALRVCSSSVWLRSFTL